LMEFYKWGKLIFLEMMKIALIFHQSDQIHEILENSSL